MFSQGHCWRGSAMRDKWNEQSRPSIRTCGPCLMEWGLGGSRRKYLDRCPLNLLHLYLAGGVCARTCVYMCSCVYVPKCETAKAAFYPLPVFCPYYQPCLLLWHFPNCKQDEVPPGLPDPTNQICLSLFKGSSDPTPVGQCTINTKGRVCPTPRKGKLLEILLLI